MTAVPDDFAELVVQGADRVGGVDYSAQHWAETPGTGRTGSRRPRTPGSWYGVPLSEFGGGEVVQCGFGGIGIDGLVDSHQHGSDGFVVLVVHESHRCPDQVDHIGLDHRLGPCLSRWLREPGQSITTHDQDITNPTVGQLCAGLGPEPSPLGGLEPDPQHVRDPVDGDTSSDMGRFVANVSFVRELHHQRVEVAQGVERPQGILLLCPHLVTALLRPGAVGPATGSVSNIQWTTTGCVSTLPWSKRSSPP